MKKIALLLFVFTGLVLQAQISSRKISGAGELGTKGVIYTLPKTVIKVDVWVEKTSYTKGPYASYAKDLLGLNNMITSDGQRYAIRNMQLSYEHVPDEDQMYYAFLGNLSGRSDISKAVIFDENGAFAGISLNPIEKIGATTSAPIVKHKTQNQTPFKYHADLNQKQITDTVYVRVDVDTAVIQKASLKHTTIQKDINARALDAAKRYMNVHNKRIDLLSGYQEIAYDGDAIRVMNQELLKLEDEYLSLFAGSYKVSDEHYTFYCTPRSKQNNTRIPAFYFSESSGPQQQGGGKAVNIVIKSSNDVSSHISDVNTSGNIEGLVYRVPQTAEVSVEYQGRSYDAKIIPLPQLGVIRAANIEGGGFEIYPSTGGVKMIEIRK